MMEASSPSLQGGEQPQHKTTSPQAVKETELFLHLQADTRRIFITAAVMAEQGSNPKLN